MKMLDFRPLYDLREGRPVPKGAKRPRFLNTRCEAVALCLTGSGAAEAGAEDLFWGFLSGMFDDDQVDAAREAGIPAALIAAEDLVEDAADARAALEASMFKEGELEGKAVRTSRVFDLQPPFAKGMWIVVGAK